jgi:cytochrome c peroxidase
VDGPNEARLALGARLFADPILSSDGKTSCAKCHDPALAFTDGVPLGSGVTHRKLARNTPHLWNLAWGESYFWDGRAGSMEEQARGPIENPNEMGQALAAGVRKLKRTPQYRAAFRDAFPGEVGPTEEQVLRALAAFERTIVSPRTRFDRWADGDDAALSGQERAGFALFLGKAGCASCHSGWAFTDRAYHDIGLPGTDRGRGAVIDLPQAEHAFRTPGLRELAWTAPYMHDGRFATLDAVLDHYEHGFEQRTSLSPDQKRISLTSDERAALLAFLDTLSSENPPVPQPWAGGWGGGPAVAAASIATNHVSQKDKAFMPAAIGLKAGEQLTVVNDDTRTHNVRMDTGARPFNSGAQEPGQPIAIPFPVPGTYRVYCGIHPAMQLTVAVSAR